MNTYAKGRRVELKAKKVLKITGGTKKWNKKN